MFLSWYLACTGLLFFFVQFDTSWSSRKRKPRMRNTTFSLAGRQVCAAYSFLIKDSCGRAQSTLSSATLDRWYRGYTTKQAGETMRAKPVSRVPPLFSLSSCPQISTLSSCPDFLSPCYKKKPFPPKLPLVRVFITALESKLRQLLKVKIFTAIGLSLFHVYTFACLYVYVFMCLCVYMFAHF